MIFLYADGASRGNPGQAAYGVHIADVMALIQFFQSLVKLKRQLPQQKFQSSLSFLHCQHQRWSFTLQW
jgi:hypothetical protein